MKKEVKRNMYLYEVVDVRADALGVVEEHVKYRGPGRADARGMYDEHLPYAVIDQRTCPAAGLELRAWIVPVALRPWYRKFKTKYSGNWIEGQALISMIDNGDDDDYDKFMNGIYAGLGYNVLKREGGCKK